MPFYKLLWLVTAAMKLKALAPWKKSYDKPRQHITLDITKMFHFRKSRHIILLTKVHIVKAMVFPVVTYRCEIWSIKKAECRRIDATEF